MRVQAVREIRCKRILVRQPEQDRNHWERDGVLRDILHDAREVWWLSLISWLGRDEDVRGVVQELEQNVHLGGRFGEFHELQIIFRVASGTLSTTGVAAGKHIT